MPSMLAARLARSCCVARLVTLITPSCASASSASSACRQCVQQACWLCACRLVRGQGPGIRWLLRTTRAGVPGGEKQRDLLGGVCTEV